jgi:hypothetical protein
MGLLQWPSPVPDGRSSQMSITTTQRKQNEMLLLTADKDVSSGNLSEAEQNSTGRILIAGSQNVEVLLANSFMELKLFQARYFLKIESITH